MSITPDITEPDSSNFQDAYVEAAGIETHYWEVGPDDGIPLVLIHGGGAGADSWGNWKYAMPRLSGNGFHVFAMDMVGFGKSATPDPTDFSYTNRARTDQLLGFLDVMGLSGDASLIGNSMGGAASLGVAMREPDAIDKLVLVGGAGYKDPNGRSEAAKRAVDTLASFDGTRERMYDVIDVLSVADWYDIDAMVDHRISNFDRDGVHDALEATMAKVNEGDMHYEDREIEQIDTETLLIYGRDDVVIPPTTPWGIFNLIEDASLHILNDCGHWVMVDQVERSVGIVSQFFRSSH